MLVVGWPLPYIEDFHGISPGGSADLVGALLGMDLFHPAPFVTDIAFYAIVVWLVLTLAARTRRRRRENAGVGVD